MSRKTTWEGRERESEIRKRFRISTGGEWRAVVRCGMVRPIRGLIANQVLLLERARMPGARRGREPKGLGVRGRLKRGDRWVPRRAGGNSGWGRSGPEYHSKEGWWMEKIKMGSQGEVGLAIITKKGL